MSIQYLNLSLSFLCGRTSIHFLLFNEDINTLTSTSNQSYFFTLHPSCIIYISLSSPCSLYLISECSSCTHTHAHAPSFAPCTFSFHAFSSTFLRTRPFTRVSLHTFYLVIDISFIYDNSLYALQEAINTSEAERCFRSPFLHKTFGFAVICHVHLTLHVYRPAFYCYRHYQSC